ncbi:hypothetical protein I030019A5_00600 [Bifidobacterium bifidum]
MIPPVPAPAAPAPPLVSMAAAHTRPAIPRASTSAANAVQPNEPLAMRTQAMPATCGRSGRPPPPRTRVPRGRARRPRPFAGLAVTDVPPRRTPLTPDSRTTLVTRPRPIPAGSRPSADNRARVSCLLPWFHHLPSS